MRELPVEGDPDTAISSAAAGLPYHAYSASGLVTAPVVYAGYGEAADYDWLVRQGHRVRGRVVVVRYSGPRAIAASAVWAAEQHGAAGILMYSGSRDEDLPKGRRIRMDRGVGVRIERGSIVYDFLVPGDPLTPGWASVAGAKRIDRSAALSLPKIPSIPLSAADARLILQSLGGPAVPRMAPSDLCRTCAPGQAPPAFG